MWVRVRRDSAIKKLLKIFIFIFSIYFYYKIFLKNTLLCLDSQKERKKKASFGFSGHIQGRFRPFPACFGRFSAYFGRPDMADTARFWPNQLGSARIEANSTRIEPHWSESSRVGANLRKKKNADADRRAGNRVRRRVPHRVASDTGAAPLVPRSCFLAYESSTFINPQP